MVFPGHFSTGCMRCRQRKVKCDETKPSCRRCYIYGKLCPGYTDTFHFRHHQNGLNPGKDSPGSNASRPTQQGGRSQRSRRYQKTNDRQEVTQDQVWRPAIARPPEISHDDVSLCYFIRRFVSPYGADSFPGHLTFLPSLYNRHSQGLLEMTTLSVAQMAAYNQFGDERFRLKSYQNYGRAIRKMQEIIHLEDQVNDDRVITAVLLLCTLKDISGEGSGDPGEHAAGLFYLLEKRGMAQLLTSRGVELFLLALLRLQVYSFLHENNSYTDPGCILASELSDFNPLLRAMSLMSRTLSLRHTLSQLSVINTRQSQENATLHDIPGPEEESSVVRECFETLEAFDTWDVEAALYWQNTFEGRAVPTVLGKVASGTTYYDPETACIIILVRSARLILLLSMLLYHGRMQLVGGSENTILGDRAAWGECIPILEQEVHKTIDDVLSCVPYALGDIDPRGQPASMAHDGAGAIIIVQSIRLITSCSYATEDQIRTARSILSRINGSIGIRSATGWEEGEANASRWAQEQALLRSMAQVHLDETTSPPQHAVS